MSLPLPAIQPVDRNPDLPLSYAQQRIWFINELTPSNPFYNMTTALPISGPLNLSAFNSSINDIVARHETLRTCFVRTNWKPVQVIAPHLDIVTPLIDMRALPESEREAKALKLAAEESQRAFDLSRSPLFRTCLFQLDEQRHVLLLTIHHIVADALSVSLFIRELEILYDAHGSGKTPSLPEIQIQYADFSVWQREWFQSDVLQNQLLYWNQQLEGVPAILDLPTDKPRPPFLTYRGSTEAFSLPAELSESLKSLCRQERVTLFMALLGAFQAFLYRYSGQTDFLVSSGVANRNHPFLEPLIGCFINILLLRADLSHSPTFRDHLKKVREVVLGAYDHQDIPFEKLIEIINPERDLSYQPMFQVMFVLLTAQTQKREQAKADPHAESQETWLKASTDEWASTLCDLMLHVWETEGKLSGTLQYNRELFSRETMAQMLVHFRNLIESLVTYPDMAISMLPFLTKKEESCLLYEWNDTESSYPAERGIHQLFEEHAVQSPDSIALIYDDRRIKYEEVNRKANQVARHLRNIGIGPDNTVGIFIDRSSELIFAILGILKAGGAYVPLDTKYPKQRLAFMIADAQMSVIITKSWLLQSLPEKGFHAICIDLDSEMIEGQSDTNLATETTAENLAYMIYSSGSTGVPKAIAIRHGGIVNNVIDLNSRFRLGPGDRMIALSSLSFDMSVYEILGTLAAGAAIVMPKEQYLRDPSHWAELALRHQVTVWDSAPTLLEAAVNYWTRHEEFRPQFLRLAILGGDWVPITLPDRLKALVNGVRVETTGGATEASVFSIIYTVNERNPAWKSIPYGYPMLNQQVYVLDAQMQLRPLGVPGELYIGGVGLARGYFNRPDLTAEKFVPHPFSAIPGERLYRTGDLVRYFPDGCLEILGRMDHQVKLRGFRIDLGEVETALRNHPTIQEAIALIRDDQSNNRCLVGYVVPKDRAEVSIDHLRRFLKNTLPEYMIPSTFVPLDKLPLSPNGKVDRRSLPIPEASRPELEVTFQPPSTDVERVVAGIWADVLGIDKVGVNDNFFDLGGHSILAVRINSQFEEAFRIKVPLLSIFEFPTVAEISEHLEAIGKDSQVAVAKAAQILIYLDQLPEEEVETMLTTGNY